MGRTFVLAELPRVAGAGACGRGWRGEGAASYQRQGRCQMQEAGLARRRTAERCRWVVSRGHVVCSHLRFGKASLVAGQRMGWQGWCQHREAGDRAALVQSVRLLLPGFPFLQLGGSVDLFGPQSVIGKTATGPVWKPTGGHFPDFVMPSGVMQSRK